MCWIKGYKPSETCDVRGLIALFLSQPSKKPPDLAVGRLWSLWRWVDYIVSMKLRSLSLRLGCLSLRSALASI